MLAENVATSTISSTELGYLSGATNSIQTPLSYKQATIASGATSMISNNLTSTNLYNNVNRYIFKSIN